MLKRGFGIHGEYSLAVQEQVLVIRAMGPGNLELIQQYVEDVEGLVASLSENGNWGTLTILSGTPLLPPDASKLLTQTVSQEKYKGLIASAVVIDGVEFSQSVSRYWLEMYAKSGVNAAIFEDENEAIDWLRAQIPAD